MRIFFLPNIVNLINFQRVEFLMLLKFIALSTLRAVIIVEASVTNSKKRNDNHSKHPSFLTTIMTFALLISKMSIGNASQVEPVKGVEQYEIHQGLSYDQYPDGFEIQLDSVPKGDSIIVMPSDEELNQIHRYKDFLVTFPAPKEPAQIALKDIRLLFSNRLKKSIFMDLDQKGTFDNWNNFKSTPMRKEISWDDIYDIDQFINKNAISDYNEILNIYCQNVKRINELYRTTPFSPKSQRYEDELVALNKYFQQRRNEIQEIYMVLISDLYSKIYLSIPVELLWLDFEESNCQELSE
jgi:hypothetical protein